MRLGMSNFARKIREIRQNLGMSQAEFASAIGAAQGSVSKWETGKEQPRSEALRRIAQFTGQNLLELVSGREHNHLRRGGMRATRVVGSLQSGFALERTTWEEDEQFDIVIPVPAIWQPVQLSAWLVKGPYVWDRWPPGSFVITAREIVDEEGLEPDDELPSGFAYEDGEFVVAAIKRDGLLEVAARKFVVYDDRRAALWPIGAEEGVSNRPIEVDLRSARSEEGEVLGLIVATLRYEVPEARLINIPQD